MPTRALRFDLPDLRLVVAIAEAGSLGKAASALPLALSAASSRLRLLEERLGERLFERTATGVSLTPAGRIFLEHARRIQRLAGDAQHAMDSLAHAGRISLRIHTNTTGNNNELAGLLGRFLADWPQVDVQLVESSSREAMDAVLRGQAELAVIDSQYSHADLELLPFRRDRLVTVVAPGHAWAPREACAFSELAGEDLVLPLPESSLRQFLERMALVAQVPLRVRAEAQAFGVLAQLVAAGVGVGILPEAVARQQLASHALRMIPLTDAWAAREQRLAVRNLDELSGPLSRLVAFLSGAEVTGRAEG